MNATEGRIRDHAEAAAILGFTQSRMTQVMSLLLLSPEIQEPILSGVLAPRERDLRKATRMTMWEEQCRPLVGCG